MVNFRRFLLGVSTAGSLLVACGRSEQPAQAVPAARPPLALPTVVEAARHYAELLARSAPLTTPAQRLYAGQQAARQPVAGDSAGTATLSWRLPTYEIHAFVNQQQQLMAVSMQAPYVPDDPERAVFEPRKALPRLVRLRDLRQAFGHETMVPPAALMQCTFSYRSAAGKPLMLLAFLPTDAPTDTTMVRELAISPAPPN